MFPLGASEMCVGGWSEVGRELNSAAGVCVWLRVQQMGISWTDEWTGNQQNKMENWVAATLEWRRRGESLISNNCQDEAKLGKLRQMHHLDIGKVQLTRFETTPTHHSQYKSAPYNRQV